VAVRAVSLRYRCGVAARLFAATAGAYGVAALVAIACARGLPLDRIEAVYIGTIAALIAMPVAAMACFWARSAWRAWAGILLCCVLLGAVALATDWRP
jgi:hypothetical protein